MFVARPVQGFCRPCRTNVCGKGWFKWLFRLENRLIYMHGLLHTKGIVEGKQNSQQLLLTEYSILTLTSSYADPQLRKSAFYAMDQKDYYFYF
jgi:hypothetical protein